MSTVNRPQSLLQYVTVPGLYTPLPITISSAVHYHIRPCCACHSEQNKTAGLELEAGHSKECITDHSIALNKTVLRGCRRATRQPRGTVSLRDDNRNDTVPYGCLSRRDVMYFVTL